MASARDEEGDTWHESEAPDGGEAPREPGAPEEFPGGIPAEPSEEFQSDANNSEDDSKPGSAAPRPTGDYMPNPFLSAPRSNSMVRAKSAPINPLGGDPLGGTSSEPSEDAAAEQSDADSLQSAEDAELPDPRSSPSSGGFHPPGGSGLLPPPPPPSGVDPNFRPTQGKLADERAAGSGGGAGFVPQPFVPGPGPLRGAAGAEAGLPAAPPPLPSLLPQAHPPSSQGEAAGEGPEWDGIGTVTSEEERGKDMRLKVERPGGAYSRSLSMSLSSSYDGGKSGLEALTMGGDLEDPHRDREDRNKRKMRRQQAEQKYLNKLKGGFQSLSNELLVAKASALQRKANSEPENSGGTRSVVDYSGFDTVDERGSYSARAHRDSSFLQESRSGRAGAPPLSKRRPDSASAAHRPPSGSEPSASKAKQFSKAPGPKPAPPEPLPHLDSPMASHTQPLHGPPMPMQPQMGYSQQPQMQYPQQGGFAQPQYPGQLAPMYPHSSAAPSYPYPHMQPSPQYPHMPGGYPQMQHAPMMNGMPYPQAGPMYGAPGQPGMAPGMLGMGGHAQMMGMQPQMGGQMAGYMPAQQMPQHVTYGPPAAYMGMQQQPQQPPQPQHRGGMQGNGHVERGYNGAHSGKHREKDMGSSGQSSKEKAFELVSMGQAAELVELVDAGELSGEGGLEARDEAGNTLLSVACMWGHKRLIRHLLKRGADVNCQNGRGQTPLHYCFGLGHPEIGDYLFAKGADDKLANVYGLTCYEGLVAPGMPADVSTIGLYKTFNFENHGVNHSNSTSVA